MSGSNQILFAGDNDTRMQIGVFGGVIQFRILNTKGYSDLDQPISTIDGS